MNINFNRPKIDSIIYQFMDTKILMISSTIFLGINGIIMTFLPSELSNYLLGIKDNQVFLLLLQILGSFYLGFAILNWMTKNQLIGGIYNRPLIIANLLQFFATSCALIKILPNLDVHFKFFIFLTVIYCSFTICFGFVFMKNPKLYSKI